MPSFVDAVVVTVACGLGTLVGKALSRPSGRSMEDLAWGIDLAVAAIAIQVSILANPPPGPSEPRVWCLAGLFVALILFMFFMREWGCVGMTDRLKQSAIRCSCTFGIASLNICFLVNTETFINLVTGK